MSVSQIDPSSIESKNTSVPNKAASLAMARLKAQHSDEWQELLTQAYASLGVTRKVRRTPEQAEAEKAAAKTAKTAAFEATRREKALATAQALALEFPDMLSVTAQTSPGF